MHHFQKIDVDNQLLSTISFFLILNVLFKEISGNARIYKQCIGDADKSALLQIINNENTPLNWIHNTHTLPKIDSMH